MPPGKASNVVGKLTFQEKEEKERGQEGSVTSESGRLFIKPAKKQTQHRKRAKQTNPALCALRSTTC